MRWFALLLLAALALVQRPVPAPTDYPLAPVPLKDARITYGFWKQKAEVNRRVTIPAIAARNDTTGRIDNFRKAAQQKSGPYQGKRFNDSDVYKTIEAAAYSLQAQPDPALEKSLDDLTAAIAAAQEPDGYLYTARTVDPKNLPPGAGPARWSWMHTSHELYNMGHMIEAAVAYYQVTGKRALLDVAIKAADLICRQFGPDRMRNTSGHQEIELALVRLYRVTLDRKYLRQAKFFLDERGRRHSVVPPPFKADDPFAIYNDLEYRQDHAPVVEQLRGVGHAVRAVYMYSGMTDVATLLGEAAYAKSVESVFRDIVSKKMYVTGGLGSIAGTEAFGDDYALPNKAYAETCASVGGMLWYHRMFLRSGDSSYMDVLERTLYNGYLSGVSLAGDTFFYENPLISEGGAKAPERVPYFEVACCPSNLARLMGQLPSLVYSTQRDTLFVNLFIGSEATAHVNDTAVRIAQTTEYPWDGKVRLEVRPEANVTMALAIRVPGWTRGEAMPSDLYRFTDTTPAPPTFAVNGRPFQARIENGYARIGRTWRAGDVVEIDIPMPVRRVVANEKVTENTGRAAIQRGPVVFAVEGVDNGGAALNARLPLDAALECRFRPELLGGVTTVTGNGVTAIPYFAWNNRGKGEMVVWIPYERQGETRERK